MNRVQRAHNIDDLALLARRRLPAGVFDYIDRGAEDEVTLHETSTASSGCSCARG